jgi:hypothetical protein
VQISDPVDSADGSTILSKMTVTIADGAQLGDSLGLDGYSPTIGDNGKLQIEVNDTPIDISYDDATKTLTFQGFADQETYEDLAQSVVLTSDNGHLDSGSRSFDVTVFESDGLSTTAQSSVNIGDGGVDLADSARGDVYFSGGTATLSGTDGSDLFIFMTDDAGFTVQGGAGLDTMAIVGADGQGADWTYTIDADNTSLVHAIQDGHELFDIHLENGTTATKDADGTIHFVNTEDPDHPADTQGHIQFHDDPSHSIDFHSVESLIS